MRNKILTSMLGVSLLCSFPAQAMTQDLAEDLSEYDIDLDLCAAHIYDYSLVTRLQDYTFDNRDNECTDTAGIISGTSFLGIDGKTTSANPVAKIALKEPAEPCWVLAGTYDVYLVMVPHYYRDPANAPKAKLKNKISASLYYHPDMSSPKPTLTQVADFEYDGEKVDTVLLYEGLTLPTSYYGFSNFFPYLQVTSQRLSNAELRNNYTRNFSLDRVLLKARSIDSEPTTVYTGTCGADATYSLDIVTGILSISGSGTMSAAPDLEAPLQAYIKEVVIGDGITEIGANVFSNMTLSSISLPKTLKVIGERAFYKGITCNSLELPEGLQEIGSYAFANCVSLRKVTLPSTLTAMGEKAFSNTNITKIEIPVNVQSLGTGLMDGSPTDTIYWNARNCNPYSNKDFPFNGIKENVTTFHIGKNVRLIPDYLCDGMNGLENLVMGENVETIGSRAFNSCIFSHLDIPAATTSISDDALVGAALASITVAEDNPAFCSVDGILFSKDKTRLVFFPNHIYWDYIVSEQVTSFGEYAFADYDASTLELPWTKAEDIPAASENTFRSDIVFYVPDGTVEIYRSLQPYATHRCVANTLLPQYMETSDKFSVFNKLLVATGWADSLSAVRDEEYELMLRQGKFPAPPAFAGEIFNYPQWRNYGFTILAETDSVYEAMTGKKAKDITVEDVAKVAGTLGIEGGADNSDYTSADNTLNLFVSYHLLPVALKHNKLVRHYNEYGYNQDIRKPGSYVTEYYETLGKGRRLLKISESSKTEGVRINRYVKLDNSNYTDLPNATDGFVPGILVEDNAARMRNGFVYAIKEPLFYTHDTAHKILGRERMRYDMAALLPELTNNKIRMEADKAFPNSSYYSYFDNMEILSSTSLYYFSGKGMNWDNYQGDELNALGVADIIVKLPPVPVDGVYELRMGTSASSRRGVFQLFFGHDKSSLSPCGLPIDMTKNQSHIMNGCEDTGIEMIDRMTDLQLREKGVMKGPNSVIRGYSGTTLRSNRSILRHIIGKYSLKAGETYYLRIASCTPDHVGQLYLDYIEWAPRTVYANPYEAEDIW